MPPTTNELGVFVTAENFEVAATVTASFVCRTIPSRIGAKNLTMKLDVDEVDKWYQHVK